MIYYKIFIIIVLALYFYYCYHFLKGIFKIKRTRLTTPDSDLPYLSIVIPACNEEEVIERTVKSIDNQNYPKSKFEIIVVNDRSTDRTLEILESLKEKISNLSIITITDKVEGVSPKKNALKTGVINSKYNYIVSSDADCFYHENWLRLYGEKAIEDHGVVAGMSVFYKESFSSWFEKLWQGFNTTDFIAHSLVAAGAMGNNRALTCNASNMMFKKNLYIKSGNRATLLNVTSGDDFFLIQTAEKEGESLEFIVDPDHVVRTEPSKTLSELFDQRARWASKMTIGTPYILTFIYTLFFMYSFTFLYPLMAIFDLFDIMFYIFVISGKVFCDLSFNFYGYGRFNLKPDLISFILYQIFNMPFNIISVAKGNLYGFVWKGEKYRR
ncbi:MAG: hypothetical protein CR982_02680 [Candidatus Cloacimonadota bacterium]|nr:MAG: hypothetical protein CR982_02680 [Candidatus Cloacimonadota bacterium]PIE79335.1 MAG: hypothetical protein CSA15_03535 [Candidatus Delongbacteria bacterium]